MENSVSSYANSDKTCCIVEGEYFLRLRITQNQSSVSSCRYQKRWVNLLCLLSITTVCRTCFAKLGQFCNIIFKEDNSDWDRFKKRAFKWNRPLNILPHKYNVVNVCLQTVKSLWLTKLELIRWVIGWIKTASSERWMLSMAKQSFLESHNEDESRSGLILFCNENLPRF